MEVGRPGPLGQIVRDLASMPRKPEATSVPILHLGMKEGTVWVWIPMLQGASPLLVKVKIRKL